mmetsp:Transcript_18411/g.59447  ORF Transcript_18411/g.59447 Transcript_18411/m.59447 type:complete len:110 (-) Transcript_18411:531-860(-)
MKERERAPSSTSPRKPPSSYCMFRTSVERSPPLKPLAFIVRFRNEAKLFPRDRLPHHNDTIFSLTPPARPSVCLSVSRRPSVRPSIRPSAHPSVLLDDEPNGAKGRRRT